MNVDIIRRSVIATVLFGFTAGGAIAQETTDSAGTAGDDTTVAPDAAPEISAAVEDSWSWLSAGGDFRAREVHFDDIPIIADPPGVTRGGMNHFFRFRTRLWARADAGEFGTYYGRLTHEFRYNVKPDNNTAWEWSEEAVVDSLYVDYMEIEDWSFRVGRQDFAGPVTGYGTGKLILDGTPKDGSRTIYFDALKIRYSAIENMTVDVVGVYNQPENELAINSQDRDVTGYTAGYNDMTESGAFVYLKDNRFADTPYEAYYIYKRESSWVKGDDPMSGGNFNTFGGRLMPKMGEDFAGNLEVAYQFGNRGAQDQEAWMVDAVVDYAIPAMTEKGGKLSLGIYYLSGDDPDTMDDEGWNPLWARWPQYSELYVYAFDAEGAGRWSNVIFPHLDFAMRITDSVGLKAYIGQMLADEANGPGGGTERGWLGVIRSDFTLAQGNYGKVTGHLLAEAFDPGDYYNVSEMAHFLRWELLYSF